MKKSYEGGVYDMSDKRTGEILMEQLKQWEVDHIYGMPDDSINEFIEDLRSAEDYINFIQIRHEEVGASGKTV